MLFFAKMKISPSHNPCHGRTTLSVTVWLLGVLMLAQVIAIGWAMLRRRTPVGPESVAQVPAVVDSPAAGGGATASGNPGAPAVIPAPAPESTAAIPAPEPVRLADQPAPLDVPLTEAALFYLEKGQAARDKGDLKTAVEELRRAADVQPRHPMLLHELAKVYDGLDLPEKSAVIWDELFKLGPGAGTYYHLAQMKFENTVIKESPESMDVVSLGRVFARKDQPPGTKQRVTLRIPVDAREGTVPDVARISFDVRFYDMVGTRIEETSADVVKGAWTPVTAVPGSQIIGYQDITYTLPEGAAAPALPASGLLPPLEDLPLEGSLRSYHGYVVKLYYNDCLQGMAAEPRSLATREDSPAPDANPLSEGDGPTTR